MTLLNVGRYIVKTIIDQNISYILKEKHYNKCIHTIIDTLQSHNDLIINMLTRSHYILCIFKYKTHMHGSNKTLDFSVRIKTNNESKAKLYIYIYYFYCLRIKLSKIFINFDSIRYPFWFEPKNMDIRNSTKQINY